MTTTYKKIQLIVSFCKTATYSYDSILRRNRTVINTTTPIDHQYVYWMPDRGNNCAPRRLAGNISANISIQKGIERVAGLKNIIKKGGLSSSELALAKRLLEDLEKALRGK